MILFCAGDKHVTGAEVVTNHIDASTDPAYNYLGDLPHPDNLKECWPKKLAETLKASLHLGKTSNVHSDIILSVKEWLRQDIDHDRSLVIVQWPSPTVADYNNIWRLHQQLMTSRVNHLFFNTDPGVGVLERKDWGRSYLEPRSATRSYKQTLNDNGFATVSPTSPYFGKEAHSYWAQFMLSYLMTSNLIPQ